MSWTKDDKGKLTVWVPDGKGNPNKVGDNTNPKPTFAFGDTSSSTTTTGLNIGFGIQDKGKDVFLPPVKIEPYIVTLARTNPKAYANIQKAVYAASGKNIKDPNTLGAWVSRLAENIFYSTDPMVKTLSIEDFLRNTAKAVNVANAPSLPQRQIYQYTEADRMKTIDDVSMALRGQNLTEEDKKTQWYTDLKKSIDNMVNTGSLTTTVKKKNPKTGKLESVATTVPGYSAEKATTLAESAIAKATPEDIARKDRVDFTGWLFSSLGGK